MIVKSGRSWIRRLPRKLYDSPTGPERYMKYGAIRSFDHVLVLTLARDVVVENW